MILAIPNQKFSTAVLPFLFVTAKPSVKASIGANVGARRFSHSTIPDSFTRSNLLDRYLTKTSIEKMVKENPMIKKILDSVGVKCRISTKILADLKNNHLQTTKNIADGIVANLPKPLKSTVNRSAVINAADLHDIGKVLIPEKIVNKAGRLTAKEKAIMNVHPELSYELLKTSGIGDESLNLIRCHHQNPRGTGYPKVNADFICDLNQQIVTAADMYSALREPRPYKGPLSKNRALGIIYKKVKAGEIHSSVFKALVDYANKIEHIKHAEHALEMAI